MRNWNGGSEMDATMDGLKQSMARVRLARESRHEAAKGIAGGPPLTACQRFHAIIQSDARRESRAILAALRGR